MSAATAAADKTAASAVATATEVRAATVSASPPAAPNGAVRATVQAGVAPPPVPSTTRIATAGGATGGGGALESKVEEPRAADTATDVTASSPAAAAAVTSAAPHPDASAILASIDGPEAPPIVVNGAGEEADRIAGEAASLLEAGEFEASVTLYRQALEAAQKLEGHSECTAVAVLMRGLSEAIGKVQAQSAFSAVMSKMMTEISADDHERPDEDMFLERMMLLRGALDIHEAVARKQQAEKGGTVEEVATTAKAALKGEGEGDTTGTGAGEGGDDNEDDEESEQTLLMVAGPEVADTLQSLAAVHDEMGDESTAEQLYRAALAVRERAQGAHPDTARTLQILANLLEGKVAMMGLDYAEYEAEEHDEDDDDDDEVPALEEAGGAPGAAGAGAGAGGAAGAGAEISADPEKSSDSSKAKSTKAELEAEAVDTYTKSMEMFKACVGDSERTADAINNLASFLRQSERDAAKIAQAEELFNEALAMRIRVLGAESAGVGDIHFNLASMMQQDDRYEDAYNHMSIAAAIYAKVYPEGHDQHEEAEEAAESAAELEDIVKYLSGDTSGVAGMVQRMTLVGGNADSDEEGDEALAVAGGEGDADSTGDVD